MLTQVLKTKMKFKSYLSTLLKNFRTANITGTVKKTKSGPQYLFRPIEQYHFQAILFSCPIPLNEPGVDGEC